MNQVKGFNPIKEDQDGKKAMRMIWSSDVLSVALKGLEEGRRLVANPFYENNTKLLKGDLTFQRTQWEIDEWKHCKKDILYFANTYCKLLTPKGIQHITLRDYQQEYLEHLQKHRLSIMCSCRQAGKTVTSAIFMLHYILFNIDKEALILGDARKTAIEILLKVKNIFYELPFFLKPGVLKWNESDIVLDNGCRCLAEATTAKSGISHSAHVIMADEFSKINSNIQELFYSHLLPAVTAANARFIISSTVNGKDLFYRIYMGALAGENDYGAFTVTWDRVPEWSPEKQCWEKRDEAWHQRQIANYGSEEAFEGQFGINFDVTSNTLINRKTIQKTRKESIKFINKSIPGVPHSDNFYWHPDYEPQDSLRNEFLIVPVDIAEGLGGDFTVAQICRLINQGNKTILETVGYFRANDVIREECSKAITTLLSIYSSPEKCLLSIERNTYGELFVKDIEKLVETDPSYRFDISSIVKYYNENMTKYTLGIKLTSNNKTPHCLLFQEDYERGLIINKSDIFSFELENFCDDGTSHYKASFGHDDTVMSMVQLEFVKKTLQYKNFIEEFETYNPTENDNIYNPYSYTPEDFNNPIMLTSMNPYQILDAIQKNTRSRLL